MSWDVRPLGDVVSVVRKINAGKALPYVGMEHISSGTGEFLGDLSPLAVKSNTFRFEPGQLLYGRLRPYLNKVLLPDFSGHCSTEVFPFQPSNEVDSRFLFYWITSEPVVNRINATCTGARMPRANVDEVLEFELPIPPLPEQQRIVGKLDAAFAALAEAQAHVERNRANARELFESYLNGVFEGKYTKGPVVPLSELASNITDGDHMPPPKAKDGIPFITISNIEKRTRRIDFTDTFKVPSSYYEGLKANRRPQRGDVLYTVTGSYGIPVLVDTDEPFCFQRHIALVRPKPGIVSRWLFYLLRSPQILEQANEGATGTAQKTVSLSLLRSLRVPQPTLELQQRMANELDVLSIETDALETTYAQKLTELEGLKKAVLGAAFRGEL